MDKKTISDIAYDLFREKGYEKVSVQEICDACNITKPTFYSYVKSKENLLVTFYDDVTVNIVSNLSTILSANNSWEQFLIIFRSLIQESYRVGADINSQLFISNLKSDSNSFDLRDNLTEIMVSIIKRGQDKNEILNQSTPEVLYEAAAYTFTGYEVMWCIKKGDLEWEKRLFSAFEAMFDVRKDIRIYS